MPLKYSLRTALLLLLLLVFSSTAIAQTRSVFWQRWDVVIDNIDTTVNRFDVAEIYEVVFNGQFRFGSALIPMDRLEEISNVRVYENGVQLSNNCTQQPGTVCVTNEGTDRSIVYYFREPVAPGGNVTRFFRIEYTVVGALRSYEGGDQLWWSAVPPEHFGFPIRSSTVIVNMPPGSAPREGLDPVVTYGAPGSVRLCRRIDDCPDVKLSVYLSSVPEVAVVAQATRQIGGNESFEIRVQYPHNPAMRVPGWQANFDLQRAFDENIRPLLDYGIILLALLIGIGGPLLVLIIYSTRGRDPQIGPVPQYLSEPPSDLPAAVVGTLIDEQANLRDVVSTLIDLARRGYIVIEEEQKKGLFGITSREFTFKRTDKGLDDLRRFEKRFMEAVFPGQQMERSLDSLRNNFYKHIPRLQTDLYTELVRGGFFKTSPEKTRRAWAGIGSGITGLAMFGFFGSFALVDYTWAIICIPIALLTTGMATSMVGRYMPAKTRKGAEEAAKWNAFLRYLRNVERYGDLPAAAERFEQYLPYTVAFGIDRSWVHKFRNVETIPIPGWYFPRYAGGRYARGYRSGTPLGQPAGGLPGDLARAGGDMSLETLSGGLSSGLESISSGLTNMLESAGRVLGSSPQGSSGSWSSGGRGFSGGGGGGGGFSGGGSRGFG